MPFGVLLAIVFGLGLFTAPYVASQRLVLPEVVGEDEQRVSQANFSPLCIAWLAAPWFALPIWALVFSLPAWRAGAALVVCGFAVPFVNAPLIMLLTLRTTTALRGKVMTTVSTSEYLTQPVGYALSGPAFTNLGLGGAYAVVAGGLSAEVALFAATLRRAGGLETGDLREAA